MEERLLSLLRWETVVLQQGLQCPVIEADKMESLVLRTELLYGHLLRIHELREHFASRWLQMHWLCTLLSTITTTD